MYPKTRKHHHATVGVFAVVYLATWLPFFGIMNSLTFVGPLPLPLAWILGLNTVGTGIIIYAYYKFFRPRARKMDGGSEVDRT